MVEFIDTRRERYGVEPICKLLQIAPSWYYEQKARQADPKRLLCGFAEMPSFAARFVECGRRTSGPTERARCGGS
jgi:hypothetical protein